jgi:hypothetical protein
VKSTFAVILLLASGSAFAQVTPVPADLIVPVVGSARGQSNAIFRTELQLTNPHDEPISGWLYLRPQLLVLRFALEPHTTRAFEDVVAEMGGSGLGSLDVLADEGDLPTIVARAYDDQPHGTTGVSVPALTIDAILSRGARAALIAPRDLIRYRFNIGVRVLGESATLELVVFSANGTQRHVRTLDLPAHHFEQQPANVFAGVTLEANDSIRVRIIEGSAIVYGSTIDNATNDSSLQLLRR